MLLSSRHAVYPSTFFCFSFFSLKLVNIALVIMFPQRSSQVYRMPQTHQPPPALELAENLEYPNLNVADLNARLENLSPRLHDCWDSIAINEQQHIALATNRREGRHWWGMFFGYARSQVNHMSVDSADFKLQAEHTVNILRYADNDVLLVALGDTRLQAWSTYSKVRNSDQPYCLFRVGEASVHPTPISHLSVFKANKQRAVSASADGTLNVCNHQRFTFKGGISSHDLLFFS